MDGIQMEWILLWIYGKWSAKWKKCAGLKKGSLLFCQWKRRGKSRIIGKTMLSGHILLRTEEGRFSERSRFRIRDRSSGLCRKHRGAKQRVYIEGQTAFGQGRLALGRYDHSTRHAERSESTIEDENTVEDFFLSYRDQQDRSGRRVYTGRRNTGGL